MYFFAPLAVLSGLHRFPLLDIDIKLSILDDIEEIPSGTLLNDDVSRRDGNLPHGREDVPFLLFIQVSKQEIVRDGLLDSIELFLRFRGETRARSEGRGCILVVNRGETRRTGGKCSRGDERFGRDGCSSTECVRWDDEVVRRGCCFSCGCSGRRELGGGGGNLFVEW